MTPSALRSVASGGAAADGLAIGSATKAKVLIAYAAKMAGDLQLTRLLLVSACEFSAHRRPPARPTARAAVGCRGTATLVDRMRRTDEPKARRDARKLNG
jgi:hypothetical protein